MSTRGPYRMENLAKGSSPIEFKFNGRLLHGVEGDTLASALLANGVRTVSRSLKFHRPRGVFSAGYEEPNALFRLHQGAHTILCARATLVPISKGIEVFSDVGWPRLRLDALRVLDCFHPVFAAGFYNKSLFWPSWRFYEPFIRKLAGLGRAPTGADPDRYETRHENCDVLIVGGGASGKDAARSASATGARVILVDQNERFSGDVSSLQMLPNVRMLPSTTAVAFYDHKMLALVENTAAEGVQRGPRERLWLVRAARVILATGALEQSMVFCNNDRPGIMLAGAALSFAKGHSVAVGRRVVVATNNDSAYAAAAELKKLGVNVMELVDSRDTPPAALVQELARLGIRANAHCMPIDTSGFSGLSSVRIGSLDPSKTTNARSIKCDALLVSGGWSPTLHLFSQAGGTVNFCEIARTFTPVTPIEGVEFAGPRAAGRLGERVSPIGNAARQWVDLRHDVTVADIELAIRENFIHIEHIKRYTTLGMSVDQGKLGQSPALEVIAKARGLNPSVLGHSTFRPPFVPVTLGTMVGRNVGEFYAPFRRSPLHESQRSAGALLEHFGEWQRAAAFPRCNETRQQATTREIQRVRNEVGLYDASPLGKIELIGPDAKEFANRFYINDLRSMTTGRVRYGIMLRETGVIFDDGTIVAMDEDHLLLTTTSAGAAVVATWLEEWRQCEWPTMRVIVEPATEQWATIVVAGRCARTILERLKPNCDLSNDAFPHLGFRVTTLLGSEARLYRVSFSGELSYEINVPSHKAHELWTALTEEGRLFGIEAIGVDALLHLRMEKGFLHIGTDTDGTTVPDDVGFGKAALMKKHPYIGRRSLSLPDKVRTDRLQLVGLAAEGVEPLQVGSHLRLAEGSEPTDGWVTSAGRLSADGTPIAMAMLRSGRSHMGDLVAVHDVGRKVTRARVVTLPFYDPEGARMHA